MIMIRQGPGYVTVKGHANDEAHPRTEETMQACAAITALVQTLLLSVSAIGKDIPDHVIGKGIFCMNTEHLSEQSQLLVDAFLLGSEAVASGYPEYIKVDRAFKS